MITMVIKPMIFVTLIHVRQLNGQHAEASHHAERRSCTLFPEAHPSPKMAIHSPGGLNNYRQLTQFQH
jgi:hypothetical protein